MHAAYYRAGADVATTASYQASVPGLMAAGLDADAAEAMIRASVAVARDVRDELAEELGRSCWWPRPSGRTAPYLADGSEYRGRYGVSAASCATSTRRGSSSSRRPGRTCSRSRRSPTPTRPRCWSPLLEELGLPAWFSYAVTGATTRAGQPLAEAYAVLAGCSPLVAVGVNCSAPRDVAGALATAARSPGSPASPTRTSARPGTTPPTPGGGRRARRRPRHTWVADGARLVGGCCRVGPDHIADLRRTLKP